jgi:hypothetical protein
VKLAVACAILVACGCAQAATFRVDDSGSLPNEGRTEMKWRSLAPSRGAGNEIVGRTVVTVRLNLAPWLNRVGRIYMGLPEQPIGTVSADWTTQGRLLPGHLSSGNRTLVYSGPIRTPRLEDTIVLSLAADGRRFDDAQRLQFFFEIEVD